MHGSGAHMFILYIMGSMKSTLPKGFPSSHFFESKYKKEMSPFQAAVLPELDAEDVAYNIS